MFVLAIDTATPTLTAGVVDPFGPLEVVRTRVAPRGHTELLSTLVARCLTQAGLAPHDLGAIVAGVGPGPYTGLRVGLVTAAALGQALDIPTYGVCSLDPMGADLARDGGDVIVVTDARRKEVYWARYDEYGHRLSGPYVTRPEDVDTAGVTLIGGAGVDLYATAWPAAIDQTGGLYVRPRGLAERAADRIASGAKSEPLVPLYLRRPDAVEPGLPKPVRQR